MQSDFVKITSLKVGDVFYYEQDNVNLTVKKVSVEGPNCYVNVQKGDKEITLSFPIDKEVLRIYNNPVGSQSVTYSEKTANSTSTNEDVHWSKEYPHLASTALSLLIKIYIVLIIISVVAYVITLIIIAPLYLLFLPFVAFAFYFSVVLLQSLRTCVYYKELRTIQLQK